MVSDFRPPAARRRASHILLPRLDTSSVTVFVAPLTRLTSTTSAMTPMMMPSIVSAARILFEPMRARAIFMVMIS